MFSNIPTFLMNDDFQAKHSDILAAARSGELVDMEAYNKARRLINALARIKRDWFESTTAHFEKFSMERVSGVDRHVLLGGARAQTTYAWVDPAYPPPSWRKADDDARA